MEANSMQQITTPWAGASDLVTGLLLTNIHHDVWNGYLRLSMGMPTAADTPPSVIYQLQFEYILGYRVLEGDEAIMANDDHINPTASQIYLVTPSRFLMRFHQQSQGTYLDEDIQHYRIESWDYCVDVLAAKPPLIKRKTGVVQ